MSENAVTFNTSRVTVSDMSVKESNDPVRTRPRTSQKNSATAQSAFSKSETSKSSFSSEVSIPSVTFVVDQSSGKSFIQVVDRNSGEILRQIPPEEARRLSEALKEMIGNVVDTLA